MLSRFLDRSERGTDLPTEWSDEVAASLLEIYRPQCLEQKRKFEVFGEVYANEISIAVSLVDAENENTIPVTYRASIDIENQEYVKETLAILLDSTSIFFDTYFAGPESEADLYEPDWKEGGSKKKTFFYMITRENIGLTKKADALLNQDH